MKCLQKSSNSRRVNVHEVCKRVNYLLINHLLYRSLEWSSRRSVAVLIPLQHGRCSQPLVLLLSELLQFLVGTVHINYSDCSSEPELLL